MAIYEHSRALAEGRSVFTSLSLVLYRVAVRIADWNARRLTRLALHSLSDEQLRDIGVSRHEIDRRY